MEAITKIKFSSVWLQIFQSWQRQQSENPPVCEPVCESNPDMSENDTIGFWLGARIESHKD